MCTLSFIPHLNGYAVGMNRDELRSRPRALAPRYFECNGVTAVYPSEPLGGTWIAVNAYGQSSRELVLRRRWYVCGKAAVTSHPIFVPPPRFSPHLDLQASCRFD